jgi:hypothetical protein
MYRNPIILEYFLQHRTTELPEKRAHVCRVLFLRIRIDGTARNAHDAINFLVLTLVSESCRQVNYPGFFQHIRARRGSSAQKSSGIGVLEHVMRIRATARESWSSTSSRPDSPSTMQRSTVNTPLHAHS